MIGLREYLAKGQVLGGRVLLDEKLGSGGFCSVWRALDLVDQHVVAVKVLHQEHEGDLGIVGRFEQEAELLLQLDHPSIVRGGGRASTTGWRFFPLEYVQGKTLRSRLDRRARTGRHFPLPFARWACRKIASVLAYAHERNVVHRDLKPANVIVNSSEKVPRLKVLDFGAAKLVTASEFDETTVGRMIGSVTYLTPEQIFKWKVDGRSDQFTLAVMMYELLTLRRAWAVNEDGVPLRFHEPFGTSNQPLDLMRRIVSNSRPSVCAVREDLPPSVDDVLQRAMAIRPTHRFPSIEEFAIAFSVALPDEDDVTTARDAEASTVDPSGDFSPALTRSLDSLAPGFVDRSVNGTLRTERESEATPMPPQNPQRGWGIRGATTEPLGQPSSGSGLTDTEPDNASYLGLPTVILPKIR